MATREPRANLCQSFLCTRERQTAGLLCPLGLWQPASSPSTKPKLKAVQGSHISFEVLKLGVSRPRRAIATLMDINFAPTLTSTCEASCFSVVMQDCYVALIGRRELGNSGSIGSALCSVLHHFSGLSTDADDMQVGPKICPAFQPRCFEPRVS